jgi:hypothetical protein
MSYSLFTIHSWLGNLNYSLFTIHSWLGIMNCSLFTVRVCIQVWMIHYSLFKSKYKWMFKADYIQLQFIFILGLDQWTIESFWIHPTPSCCSCHLFLGQRKGARHGMTHEQKKDTWLALNQSKAKYLGQTMVLKGSTWALESPGWARAGVKKRKGNHRQVHHGHSSISCFHPLLLGKQCRASLNLHLCLIRWPKLHSGWQMMPWSDTSKDWQTDHLPHLLHSTSSERILPDSPYTVLLLLPSVFGPKKGSTAWNDTWTEKGHVVGTKSKLWALESQKAAAGHCEAWRVS